VPAWLVGERKLAEISSDHVELNLNVVEGLAVVNCNIGTNHLWEDDGITEVSLDGDGLLTKRCVLLALLAFGIEPDVFMLDL
jgi:hypothetical protein